jgi:hypothetical protein
LQLGQVFKFSFSAALSYFFWFYRLLLKLEISNKSSVQTDFGTSQISGKSLAKIRR